MNPINRLIQEAKTNFIPLMTTIEITQTCNFKCLHCFNFDRSEGKSSRFSTRLSDDDILKVIDEAINEGALTLTFTGGEPLLHPGLFKFIEAVRARRKHIRIKSNASLITPEMAKRLKSAGVHEIEASLYASSQETFSHFTKSYLSIDRVFDGIKNAKEQGIHIIGNIILNRLNIPEFEAMLKKLEDMTIPHNVSLEITKRHDGTDTADIAPTKEQIEDLMKGPFKHYFLATNDCGGLQCPCATYICGISANGDVYPCIGAPLKSGNIKEKPFKDIWRNSIVLNWIRNLKSEDFKDCHSCSIKNYCQRSSGTALNNTGIYQGKDERICEITRARYEILNSST